MKFWGQDVKGQLRFENTSVAKFPGPQQASSISIWKLFLSKAAAAFLFESFSYSSPGLDDSPPPKPELMSIQATGLESPGIMHFALASLGILLGRLLTADAAACIRHKKPC